MASAKVQKSPTPRSTYLSIKMNGEEIYVENVNINEPLDCLKSTARVRLAHLRAAMPLAGLSVTIESQMSDRTYRTSYQVEADAKGADNVL